MILTGKDKYEEFALERAGIFGMPYWLDALCPDAWNAFVATDENGVILWPYHEKKKLGLTAMLMPEVSLFSGPFIQGEPKPETWIEVSAYLKSFDKIAYQCNPGFNSPEFMQDAGISFTKRTHYELYPQENPEEEYNKHTLRKLKKRSKEVELKTTNNPNNFFRLSEASYAKQGAATPYQRATLERLMETCRKHACGHIVEAITPEGVAAAVWFVYDQTTVYYFLSGVDRTLPDSGAVVKIIHQAIKEAHKTGKVFNFYGSEVPGVARFMKGFGAEPRFSYLLSYTANPILKIADKIRRR